MACYAIDRHTYWPLVILPKGQCVCVWTPGIPGVWGWNPQHNNVSFCVCIRRLKNAGYKTKIAVNEEIF